MKHVPTLYDKVTPQMWVDCVSRLAASLIIRHSHKEPEAVLDEASELARKIIDEMPFGDGYNWTGSFFGEDFPYRGDLAGDTRDELLVHTWLFKRFGNIRSLGEQGGSIVVKFEKDSDPSEFGKTFPMAMPNQKGEGYLIRLSEVLTVMENEPL